MITAADIMNPDFSRGKRIDRELEFIKKELVSNPNHPTNMYLTKGIKPDLLVDRDCGRLDGNCQCQTIEECKYIENPPTDTRRQEPPPIEG